MSVSWEWDETLYAGSAAHYPVGRVGYPPELATAIRDALGLDGTGRLLDVGCGPGSLTLLLAPLFAATVGVDADPGMLAVAARRDPGATVHWRRLRAEELPAGLGRFRVVTFAQSFHWMDQPLVATRVRPMVDQAWVHVLAQTHRGDDGTDPLPRPRPPWDAIDDLVRAYLGPVRRAGQGVLPDGTKGGEEEVMRATGFQGPTRITAVPARVVTRTADEIVSAVLSMSISAPHLFGDRLAAFTTDLRKTVGEGPFAERLLEIDLVIWTP
ncbi:class I SAM-dependent methyltransferase [Asanoa sp. NPDC050611]|uniref:class I SAM-dependent methyltransferase n=1 Tax=Asanoa sp. NPDC050611 TaxID=3157098 RepID=UPI0033D4C7A1